MNKADTDGSFKILNLLITKKEYLPRKYSKKGGCQVNKNLLGIYYEKVLINLLTS